MKKLIVMMSAVILAGMSVHGADYAEVFRTECRTLLEMAGASSSTTIKGDDNWLFLDKELRHIAAGEFWGDSSITASQAAKEDRRDPLPAIIDFKKQLDALNIELILLPVPPKAMANPDKLSRNVKAMDGKVPRLDVFHQEFYKLLAEQGITVLDVYPELSSRDGSLMYCKSDSHWSGEACVKIGKLVADRLKKSDWYKTAAKTPLVAKEVELEIAGDLGRDLADGDAAKTEKLRLRVVNTPDGQGVEADPLSPLLIMSDSHGLVFSDGGDMHAKGAGFFDQVAYELQLRPSLIAERGSGATPTRVTLYREGKADPDFLVSKKVVIWLFTAREFTETSGWAVVPVKK